MDMTPTVRWLESRYMTARARLRPPICWTIGWSLSLRSMRSPGFGSWPTGVRSTTGTL